MTHDKYDWSVTIRGLQLLDVDLYKDGEPWYPYNCTEYKPAAE